MPPTESAAAERAGAVSAPAKRAAERVHGRRPAAVAWNELRAPLESPADRPRRSASATALAKLIAQLAAQGAEVALDQLLVLDALLGQDFIDAGQAANVLQLSKDESRRILEAMCLPPLGLLERKGHTAAATFHLAKGVAKELKGKAAYTRTRGLNPIRYAEMVREYLRTINASRMPSCANCWAGQLAFGAGGGVALPEEVEPA